MIKDIAANCSPITDTIKSRKVSYEDCLRFIEHKLNIKLYDFQKEIIKAFCEGKEVRTSRGVGRTMCADAFGKYIGHLYSENNYGVEPEVIIPYTVLVKNNIISKERIEQYKKVMSPEVFSREYGVLNNEQ